MDITFQYSKRRAAFGRQALFCELGPEMCDSVPASATEHRFFVLRNPVHQPTQHTPNFAEHRVNTIRTEYTNNGINHAEGGWPKDVVVTDPEATQRYRRRVEKDDGYIHCVMSLEQDIEHCIHQNNAIDMYETYFTEMNAAPEIERNSVRTVNVFRDPGAARPVGTLAWQPEGGNHFAVTYIDFDYNRNARSSIVCYIWDIENANSPHTNITPPCSLLDLQYNPRDANILAGGLVSGQVAIWDRRQGGAPVDICPPHVAHRDMARCILFVSSKSGREFFSSGPDGVCRWWDYRKMNNYTDEMILDTVNTSNDVPSMANAHGVSALEFEPTIPTRFMAGTENGLVIGGNRKGKTALEQLPAKIEAHLGPVWSLQRNPGFLKNFLTVGDWTTRVWSEECRESAVLWSPPQRHKITAGAWSPTRLSLMLLTQWDGVLAAWDLLRRQHEPALTMQVCPEPLLRVCAHAAGSLAALGSRRGTVYMVELSQQLVTSDTNDKALLTLILDRESKRERTLEARLREIRLRTRQAGEGSPARAPSLVDLEPSAATGDRDLAEAAQEYFAAIKKEAAAF